MKKQQNTAPVVVSIICITMMVATTIMFYHQISLRYLTELQVSALEEQVAEQQSQLALLQQENSILVEDMTRLEDQLAERYDTIVAYQSQVAYLLSVKGVRESLLGLTDTERDMLKRLAMAEAGNQGVVGKALVMLSVINRMEHPTKYANTIEGVIFSGAYSVTAPGGGYWTCVPDEECDAALYLVEHGYTEEWMLNYLGLDPTLRAYYFNNQGFSYGEKLFQYKDHYFSGYTLD